MGVTSYIDKCPETAKFLAATRDEEKAKILNNCTGNTMDMMCKDILARISVLRQENKNLAEEYNKKPVAERLKDELKHRVKLFKSELPEIIQKMMANDKKEKSLASSLVTVETAHKNLIQQTAEIEVNRKPRM